MGNPRVGGSDHGEELNQSSPDAFAVVSREAPDQLDQPAEGVLHMATADVEIGDEELRVDVVRPLGGCAARLVEVGASRAGDEANTGETLSDLVVTWVLGLEPFVFGDGSVKVVVGECFVGDCEPRIGRIVWLVPGCCGLDVTGGLGRSLRSGRRR